MLKKASTKSVLLLGAVIALCAFAVPSVASAASWSPVGTSDGILDSGDLGFSIPAVGSGWLCRQTQFNLTVDSAARATITSASFASCHGNVGSAVGCTITVVGTKFPWSVTFPTTTDLEIHGEHVDVRFETTPPAGSVACANNGLDLTVTGTLGIPGQEHWLAASKTVVLGNAPGLSSDIAGIGSFPTVVNGRLRATGLLNVLD